MTQKLTASYEDNYGFWDFTVDPNEQSFFEYILERSCTIRCKRCKKVVRLLPEKHTCASCIEAREFGARDE